MLADAQQSCHVHKRIDIYKLSSASDILRKQFEFRTPISFIENAICIRTEETGEAAV